MIINSVLSIYQRFYDFMFSMKILWLIIHYKLKSFRAFYSFLFFLGTPFVFLYWLVPLSLPYLVVGNDYLNMSIHLQMDLLF